MDFDRRACLTSLFALPLAPSIVPGQESNAADLIIEAVFEDRALKATVTQDAEAQLDSSAIFASNTSTLPITGLAEASERPENFIGLHFTISMCYISMWKQMVTRDDSPASSSNGLFLVGKNGHLYIISFPIKN